MVKLEETAILKKKHKRNRGRERLGESVENNLAATEAGGDEGCQSPILFETC